MRVFTHLTKGWRKLFWLVAVLALVADLASKEWLYRPATARAQALQQSETVRTASVRGIDVADLDGDGALDVVVAMLDRIVYYTGPVEQSGAPAVVLGGLSGVTDVQALDANGDGRTDLVVAAGAVQWYEQQGDLSFAPPQPVAAAGEYSALCAGDMDADGDQDLLTVSDGLTWHENIAEGGFGPPQRATTRVPDIGALQAADMDGDGDADVLLLAGNRILWLRNSGRGNLTAGTSLEPSGNITAFHVADLDGDGDADLLTAGRVIAWYENHGQAEFAGREIVAEEVAAVKGLSTMDLDGDGDVDVLAVSEGEIAWYENTPRHPVKIIPGLLHLVPHEGNQQGAFGLGPSSPTFFIVAACIGLAVIVVLMWRMPAHRWHIHLALGLLAGGALGNLYDRLALGVVRDFIDAHWGTWHWPTFNVADMAICVGFAIVFVDSFLVAPTEEGSPEEPAGVEAEAAEGEPDAAGEAER
jgi:lipoprotein signal peptidase